MIDILSSPGLASVLFVVMAGILLKLQYLLHSAKNPWDSTELNWIQRLGFLAISEFARVWHGYEVHGLEKFKKEELEECLIISYHSRPTVDLIYTFCEVKPNILVNYLFFYIPGAAFVLPLFGIMPSKANPRDNAEERMISVVTSGKRPFMIMPGGAFECLKTSDWINKINWKVEPGYARLLHSHFRETGKAIKVIPFYTRNCESIYQTSDFWYDFTSNKVNELYNDFKKGNLVVLPVLMSCVLFSLGNFLLPRRVKLDTYFGEAIIIRKEETCAQFAARVADETQKLIEKVIQEKEPASKGPMVTSPLLLLPLSIFIVLQNVFMAVCLILLAWSTLPAVVVYTVFLQIRKRFGGSRPKKPKSK